MNLVYSPKLRVYINSDQAKSLEEARGFLSERSINEFYAHNQMGGFYFLTGALNFTYFDRDSWATEKQQREIAKTLEQRGIKYLVSIPPDIIFRGSVLDDYFREFYSLEKQFGEILIFKRNERVFDNSFFEKGMVKEFSGGWQRASEGVFETYFDPIEVSKIRIKVSAKYLPLLKSFAKTQATLFYLNKDNNWQEVSSDTAFPPDYNVYGPLSFHLYSIQNLKRLRLSFSSPGGLNPTPRKIEILETRIYK